MSSYVCTARDKQRGKAGRSRTFAFSIGHVIRGLDEILEKQQQAADGDKTQKALEGAQMDTDKKSDGDKTPQPVTETKQAKLKKQQQTEQDLQDQVTKWVDRADQDWQVLTDLKQLLEDGSNTPDLRQTQNLQGRAKELQKYLKDNEQYRSWLEKYAANNGWTRY
eukprot:GHVU01055245.1.p1 GENE.GHVU01055245.1~~GHVU01055245.1.p1  ORF type:complete len:165 (-),score=32.37 GHVU01055245.1:104-598(-)